MTLPESLAAVATGVGSWPGQDPREAAEIVVGELGALPHLVELPGRGVGADMFGRASALLIDLHFDTTTRGYRITARPGGVAKRARDLLHMDLDALEEAWETAGLAGTGKTIKVQSVGPLTLAAEIELVNGHRVLTDTGAVRDFTDSLAEGLIQHVAEVRRRLGADVVLQLDEPMLGQVLAGTLPGVTGIDQVRAVPAPNALSLLDSVIDAVDVPVIVHSCEATPPLALLRRSKAAAISLDATLLKAADLDDIGELLQDGKGLFLGLVPSTEPEQEPPWRQIVAPAVTLMDRLGFPRVTLRSQVSVTPTCGLAGASNEWARKALQLSNDAARAFAEDPESL